MALTLLVQGRLLPCLRTGFLALMAYSIILHSESNGKAEFPIR